MNIFSFLKTTIRKKRDIMVEAIKYYIPEMDFSIPNSGFFIWGRLSVILIQITFFFRL